MWHSWCRKFGHGYLGFTRWSPWLGQHYDWHRTRECRCCGHVERQRYVLLCKPADDT